MEAYLDKSQRSRTFLCPSIPSTIEPQAAGSCEMVVFPQRKIHVKQYNKCNNETLELLHEIRNTDKRDNSNTMVHKQMHQAVHRNQNTFNCRHRLTEATRAHGQCTRPEYNYHNDLTQHRST